MEPSFSIVAINQQPAINKGEDVTIHVYFSGGREIRGSKLHVLHDQPELLDADKSPDLTFGYAPSEPDTDSFEQTTRGFVTEIPITNFEILDWESETDISPNRAEVGSKDGKPPVEITLYTNDSPPPGDYTIILTYTYLGDDCRKQDQSEINVHVNDFREQHAKTLGIAAGFVGVAAVYRIFSPIIPNQVGQLGRCGIAISLSLLLLGILYLTATAMQESHLYP